MGQTPLGGKVPGTHTSSMRRFLLLILLPVTGFAAPTARRAPTRIPGPTIVSPNASLATLSAPSLLMAPSLGAPSLSLNAADETLVIPERSPIVTSEAPKIIIPKPKKIIIPDGVDPERSETIIRPDKPVIIEAERELTEEEANPEKMPSAEELKALAKSLTSEEDPDDRSAADGEMGAALSARFDGAAGMSGQDLDTVRGYFNGNPRAPGLNGVEAAAHALFRGLLPAHYHRLPATARYDKGPNPSTGHLWSAETGHIIELAPTPTDSKGDVSSAFGLPNSTFVQDRVEQLVEFAHEYAHVVFDAVVRKTDNHSPLSAYSAMTEGFAVTLEQALVERVLTNPILLGLSPRDVADFVKISQARQTWLDALDTHYSEGVKSWFKVFKEEGDSGVTAFLKTLSAGRMTKTLRADPAYQLSVESPELLSGYLGKQQRSELRDGLKAFVKATQGEELTPEEARLAEAAIDKAGPEGRHRLFMRSLFDDKRIPEKAERRQGPRWYETDKTLPLAIGPAFTLARLSVTAAEELSVFLAHALQSGNGRRLFGAGVPNDKLNTLVAEAESLPFSETDRVTWNEGIAKYLFGDAAGGSFSIGESGGAGLILPGKDGITTPSESPVFGWKPFEKSPGHGFAPFDWFIRRIMSRNDTRFDKGFEESNTTNRKDASVFLYGERHTDADLIARNMKQLAEDIKPGKGALLLTEGYFGPTLFGSEVLWYLEDLGMKREWLDSRGVEIAALEMRGWDEAKPYHDSNHAVLNHHMNLLGLNHLAYGEQRGVGYYFEVAKLAVKTFKNWLVMRRDAIAVRNGVLDRAIEKSLGDAEKAGKTLHAIVGSEHLVQKPLLVDKPVIGGYRLRPELILAMGSRSYAAGSLPVSP